MSTLAAIVSFFIISMSSQRIGKMFSSLRLPYITGYLFAGVLVGPFVLDLVHTETLEHLHFVEEISLAIIAFVVGTEIFLKELKGRFRSIGINALSQIIVVYGLGSVSVFLLTEFIPFTQDMSNQHQLAVAILAGTILVARSPAAAIAVMKELRARGTFTKTVLGVTVAMDVAIITLFALNTLLAGVLLTGDDLNLTFALTLILDLSADVLLGYMVGHWLIRLMGTRIGSLFKMSWILITGFAVFEFAKQLSHWSHDHFPIEIIIEPLLPAMIASFVVTNFSSHRVQFTELVEKIAPLIYVAFFTFTGLTLDLDILQDTLGIALALFAVRFAALALGSFIGSTLARDPSAHRKLMSLSFISQAGIALGLTREVAAEFPELGDQFATMMVSLIVLNEIVGPLFLRYALKQSGEAHIPEEGGLDDVRDALILGIEAQSIALARQLKANNWNVKMADINKPKVKPLGVESIECQIIERINEETITALMTPKTDAVVAMLGRDSDNYQAVRITSEKFSRPRLIVRLQDHAYTQKFNDLGAMVVNPTDAMVNLLDQFVRTPQTAALMMHRDANHEVIQITITDPDYHNIQLRDLRLPSDVLILNVLRDGHSLMPHGYTTLKRFDEVTLVGDPEQLEEVTRRLGY